MPSSSAKTGTFLHSAARTTQVLVDDHHFMETQLPGSFGQPVLAPLAFKMKTDLLRTRLPNVNVGRSLEMLVSNLLAHVPSEVHGGLRPPLAVTQRSVRGSALDGVREVCPTAPSSQRPASVDDNLSLVLGASIPPS